MNFAWATVALLVFLLPGFLFFLGLYFPERFTREVAQRSPLGQLAGTVLVAFLVHGGLYAILTVICKIGLPCPDLDMVFIAFQLQGAGPATNLAENLKRYHLLVLAYHVVSCACGLGLGWFVGSRVVKGQFQFLSEHGWVHRLVLQDQGIRSYTIAYILTNIQHEERVLLYREALYRFGLTKEGRFSYLVLTGCERGYMHLNSPTALVSQTLHKIGTRNHSAGTVAEPGSTLFVIEGEDVANVMFERRTYRATKISRQVLERVQEALRTEWAEMFRAVQSSPPPPPD